jgi:hypothetical protein
MEILILRRVLVLHSVDGERREIIYSDVGQRPRVVVCRDARVREPAAFHDEAIWDVNVSAIRRCVNRRLLVNRIA